MQHNHSLPIKAQLVVTKLVLALGFLVFFIFIGQLAIFAHGGEDHGDESPGVIRGGLNTRLAKTTTSEILVKYQTPKLGEPVYIKIFLTDLITNASLDKAKVALKLQYLGLKQNIALSSPVLPTATPVLNIPDLIAEATPASPLGMYRAKVVFPNAGQYRMFLTISDSSSLDAQALISGIIVLPNAPPATNSNTILTNILITLSTMLLMSLLYMFSLSQSSKRQTKKEMSYILSLLLVLTLAISVAYGQEAQKDQPDPPVISEANRQDNVDLTETAYTPYLLDSLLLITASAFIYLRYRRVVPAASQNAVLKQMLPYTSLTGLLFITSIGLIHSGLLNPAPPAIAAIPKATPIPLTPDLVTISKESQLLFGIRTGQVALETLVDTKAVQPVISIPLTALTEKDGQKVVYVYNGGERFSKRIVTIGRQGSANVEILSGLEKDERIIVTGLSQIRASLSSK